VTQGDTRVRRWLMGGRLARLSHRVS
jgi:hypothetical protein